jgi:hypothetical protein
MKEIRTVRQSGRCHWKYSRQDSSHPLKDRVALHRTELEGPEDQKEDRQQVSCEHLGKDLVVCGKKSDGTQLGHSSNPSHLRDKRTTPLRREKPRSPACSMALRAARK